MSMYMYVMYSIATADQKNPPGEPSPNIGSECKSGGFFFQNHGHDQRYGQVCNLKCCLIETCADLENIPNPTPKEKERK